MWTPIKDKGPAEIDFVVVRENTEDMYVGTGGFMHYGTPDEVATQVAMYSRKGTERIIRYAFELTRKRNKAKKLTMVDKSNVLTYGHDLWVRTFDEVASEYPDIQKDHAYVDATCMWMVKNPEWFDVIVTTNMFGDIITDLGAMIQGGMGMAASGNINPTGHLDVRADPRLGAEVHRAEQGQSAGRASARWRCCSITSGRRRRRRGWRRRSARRWPPARSRTSRPASARLRA